MGAAITQTEADVDCWVVILTGVGNDAFSAGAGFGVRYDLGFGPIRADIAIPLDRRRGDPAFQLYVSIGQSF